LDRLEGFVSGFGRAFYKREVASDVPIMAGSTTKGKVVLRKMSVGQIIDERYVDGEESVVPFWAGREICWEIVEA
jgi:dihydroorotase